MAVNGISQAHLVNVNQVNLEPAQRTQNAATKTQTAANNPTRLTRENQAQGTAAAAKRGKQRGPGARVPAECAKRTKGKGRESICKRSCEPFCRALPLRTGPAEQGVCR
jgi:hypothetical protein